MTDDGTFHIASRRRRLPAGGILDYLIARDGTRLRFAKWRTVGEGCRGTVVLLTGRREFIEKFAETIHDLLDRHFDVCTVEWRGQGLSDRPLENRHKGHVRNFDEYIDDLHQFIEAIILPDQPRPLILLAHSMGGHCGLRYLHDHPGVFDRAILSAPMVDIHQGGLPDWVFGAIADTAMRIGRDSAYALGQHDFDWRDRVFPGNRLTSDAGRFADEGAFVDQNPELALGGVTYGWLHAALASVKCIRAPGFAAAIATPVLLASAECDRVVSNIAQEALARELPNCRFVRMSGARHEILKERDPIRRAFWAAFDEFTGNGAGR
ncbi:MAG: alpha/beta fold hydrolase [Sphingomonadales bacterium]